MRILFIFILIAILLFALTDQVQGQKKFACEIDEDDKTSCSISYSVIIDSVGFTLSNELSHEVKTCSSFSNSDIRFLPENVAASFPSLTYYYSTNNYAKSVNKNHFRGLHELTTIVLKDMIIESIASDSFEDATKLEYLRLNNNQIKVVDPKWFKSMPILLELSLMGNQISHLDENVFAQLPILEELALDRNQLKTIPTNLLKNNLKLEWLGLEDNKIETVNSEALSWVVIWAINLCGNVCVNRRYGKHQIERELNPDIHDMTELKKDLDDNCTRLNN